MKLLTAIMSLLVAISVLTPTAARADVAKPAPYSGILKFEKFNDDFFVNGDGTFTETSSAQIKVLTDAGLQAANEVDVSYSEGLGSLEIISAYTLKKDGSRVDVPAENIQERAAVATGGPMYSDIKTRVIIFPDLEVGDSVGYSYKLTQTTAAFPGQFSMAEAFGKFVVYDDARISVSVPASLPVRVFASDVQGGRAADSDGRTKWAWTYKNSKIVLPESGAVSPMDYGPRVIVSTFKDYGAIAAAYELRAKPTAAVTDKIRKLADDLTRGVKGKRAQAKALYEWVARNINYAGNCIGVGSVVPHDAEMVLTNRLGDCKDHTTLLEALLAAKGIKSTPALVNAGTVFSLPEVPSVEVFNHVISYIPGLDVYADATSKYTPFGSLPPSESGKPVILTAAFDGIRHTPTMDYRDNVSHGKTVLTIHKDGSADGKSLNEEKGIFASGVRALLSMVQPNMEERGVRAALARAGYTGTGTLTKDDPKKPSATYTYGSKYHLNDAMNIPGPGAMRISPVFANAAPIASALGDLNMPERTLDFGCFGGISVEEYTYNLPHDVKITAMPRDMSLEKGNISYSSTYRLKGNVVTVVRKLVDRTPGGLCTPAEDRAERPAEREILKDLKAEIIYQ